MNENQGQLNERIDRIVAAISQANTCDELTDGIWAAIKPKDPDDWDEMMCIQSALVAVVVVLTIMRPQLENRETIRETLMWDK